MGTNINMQVVLDIFAYLGGRMCVDGGSSTEEQARMQAGSLKV